VVSLINFLKDQIGEGIKHTAGSTTSSKGGKIAKQLRIKTYERNRGHSSK
jgi:hypothetical protein